MIIKLDSMYRLVCDVCQTDAPAAFFEHGAAVQYKKGNGWKSQRRGGEWEDVCPDCAGKKY